MDIIPNYNKLFVKVEEVSNEEVMVDGILVPAGNQKSYLVAEILEVGKLDTEKYEYYKGEKVIIKSPGIEIDPTERTFIISVEQIEGSVVTK